MNYDPQNNNSNPYDPQNRPTYDAQRMYDAPKYDSTAKGMGIASLILGIVGLVFGGFLFGVAGLVLAIMAGNRGYKEGVRTAGLVLSIIATVYGLIMTILVVVIVITSLSAGLGFLDALTNIPF